MYSKEAKEAESGRRGREKYDVLGKWRRARGAGAVIISQGEASASRSEGGDAVKVKKLSGCVCWYDERKKKRKQGQKRRLFTSVAAARGWPDISCYRSDALRKKIYVLPRMERPP